MKSKSAPNLYEILKGSRTSKTAAAISEKKDKEPVAVAVKSDPKPKSAVVAEPEKPVSSPAKADPKPVPASSKEAPVAEIRNEDKPSVPSAAPKAPVATVPEPRTEPAPKAVPEPTRVEAESTPPTPPQPPRIMVRPPDPVKPATAENGPCGPGERVLSLTYNTIGFSVLVVLGLLFIAYSVGLRQGRAGGPLPTEDAALAEGGDGGIEETERSVEAGPSVVPGPAPVAEERFSIQLMKWKADSSREAVSNKNNAQVLQGLLSKRGMKDAWFEFKEERGRRFLVLYYGKYTRADETKVREAIGGLQGFRYTRSSDNSICMPFKKCTEADIVLLEG